MVGRRPFAGARTRQSAILDMTKRNVLTPNATDPFVKTQIGRQRSKGFETELTLDLRRGTYVSATYTYLDAVVENDKNAALIRTTLSNVPKNMAAIYANQAIGVVSVGAGVNYVGSLRFGL